MNIIEREIEKREHRIKQVAEEREAISKLKALIEEKEKFVEENNIETLTSEIEELKTYLQPPIVEEEDPLTPIDDLIRNAV